MYTKRLLQGTILIGLILGTACQTPDPEKGGEAFEWKLEAPITVWDEALPLGNGLTGCLVWGEKNQLRFSFDRGDLWDNRVVPTTLEPGFTWANLQKLVKEENAEEIVRLTDEPYWSAFPTKLPGVRLELEMDPEFQAKIFNLKMLQASVEVESESEESLTVFTSATQPVTLIRCPAYMKAALVAPTSIKILGYPDPQSGSEGDNLWWSQKTVEDLEYGAYLAVKHLGNEILIALSFTSNRDADDFMALAQKQAEEALESGYDKLLAEHEAWWDDFWSTSDISIPDLKHQRYYNMMQYYYGAASRKGYPPMPLQGLWTADAGGLPPWKGDFHNDLNVQMSYWAYLASGRFESGESMIDFFIDLAPVHRQFAKSFFGVEGLMAPAVMGLEGQPLTGWAQYALSPTMSVWLLQNFHWHWLYTMDEEFLRERCYPYCKEMAIAMEAILVEDENGYLKMPLSASPEIHNNSMAAWLTPNSNSDLSVLIWMADAMVEMAGALDLEDDVKHWMDFRSKLEDLAVNEDNVLMLAPDESLYESHRHFAHLMSIHPFPLIHLEGTPQEKEIMLASLDNLRELGFKGWVGFSFSWASCLESRAGRADDAYEYLDVYLEEYISRNGFNVNWHQVKENPDDKVYRDFTLEANFAASQAIHEMLLQTWGGKVRIFPAVPSQWEDVSFRDLRAEGGYIISAELKAGETVSLQIKATVDSKLKLKDPFGGMEVKWNRDDVRKVGEYYECDLGAGEELKKI